MANRKATVPVKVYANQPLMRLTDGHAHCQWSRGLPELRRASSGEAMRTLRENVVLVIHAVALWAACIGLAACGNSSGATAGKDASDDVTLGANGGDARGGSSSGGGGASGGLSPGMFSSDGGCLGLGGACANGAQCCSGDCANGVCSYPSCTSDNQACTTSGNCCSQNCVAGMCAPLNGSCKTIGNSCASSAECCSGRCASGTCQASSFCAQPGDACRADGDCCTGTCTTPDAGQGLGTCGASPPTQSANCKLADGQLCGGTGTSGTTPYEGGLPVCGGACCSRACAPWGPTGVLICQPASGCHVVGDLCTQDSDCCGSNGLPGGSGKPVTCVITAPSTVGVCRNPMGCKPDGDVCRLSTMTCNSSCDCCSGNCHQDTCRQDNVGVPRCSGPCVDAGASCASSASCCGNMPCVPNPVAGGMPPYVCAGTQCIAACGLCTNNADCCPGTSCILAAGTARGICGPCGGNAGDGGAGPPPPYDGGGPNGGDGGVPPPPPNDSGTCGNYGQICVTNADCCAGIPCTNFRCEFPTL